MTATRHEFDLSDGYCHIHRTQCSMAATSLGSQRAELRIPDGMDPPDTPWWEATVPTCPTEYKRWGELTRGDVITVDGIDYAKIVEFVTVEQGPQLDRVHVHWTDGPDSVAVARLWVRVARAVEIPPRDTSGDPQAIVG